MRLRTAAVQEEVSPNLIPMVDIMFLLLLFFMLSADMGQRTLEDVRLPAAQMATDDKGERLTINVFHDPVITCHDYAGRRVCREDRHWKTGIRGREFRDIPTLAAYLRDVSPREAGDPRRSSRHVMIRSDAAAPYGLAQRAMDACVEAGIYRLEVGAALPPGQRARP